MTVRYTFKHELQKLILKLCHSVELPLHKNHKGPKIFSEYQRISLLILFKRSGKSLRDFVRTLPEQRWVSWLDLRELPSKSTLHNWFMRFPNKTLSIFNHLIIKGEQPKLMAVDGTGIDSWQRSRHYERRINDPLMPYAKLDLIIDVDTMLIHDHVLRLKPRHDCVGATQMIKRNKWKYVKILADRGYDSEPLHKLVRKKGCRMYAPVRDFKVLSPKGFYRKQCLEPDMDYPRRNSVESTIHALKSTRVSCLRSKKGYMKKREMQWYVLIYNLEKIIKKIISLMRTAHHVFWTRPVGGL